MLLFQLLHRVFLNNCSLLIVGWCVVKTLTRGLVRLFTFVSIFQFIINRISLQRYTDSEVDGQLEETISITSPGKSVRSGGILVLFNEQDSFGM